MKLGILAKAISINGALILLSSLCVAIGDYAGRAALRLNGIVYKRLGVERPGHGR
jgi:hypothetical protein